MPGQASFYAASTLAAAHSQGFCQARYNERVGRRARSTRAAINKSRPVTWCVADPAGGFLRWTLSIAVPPDEGRGDIDLSKTGALDIVKRKAGEHARTYYVVRCRSCGRLGSYEPLDQAQARVDQHRSHSSQADHDVVITKHPQTKA